MGEPGLERRAGCKRARRTTAVSIAMRAVLVLLMGAPHIPTLDALKLSSISEERGHLGVGLLRAVEVVRGRYERAWTLVSASEPTAEDLDTALELLQENAKQWESLEPAVKLWTERDNDEPPRRNSISGSGSAALARSGNTDRGIQELELACPEILEYQQNAQGRRDSKSWLHCYANLAEMYKTQKRFEEASSLLARMPWLPSPQGTTAAAAGGENASSSSETPPEDNGVPSAPLGDGRGGADRGPRADGSGDGGVSDGGVDPETSPPGEGEGAAAAVDSVTNATPSSSKGSGGRSDAPPPRGAGAARVAGLNKAAAAASAAAAAESAAAAAAAVETGAEAAARAVVERHAEAMRASMNELVGELVMTTATRPSATQEWLDSRVVAAEEILAAVRSGLLAVTVASSEQAASGGGNAAAADAAGVDDVPAMVVGAAGHADILREASHYLSAVKGVAAQGWAYVDNELHRMERHPAQPVKSGFQSRREVIHRFRYLLMKARQYASENQTQTTRGGSGSSSQAGSGSGSRWRRKDRGRKASASSKAPRNGSAARGKHGSGSDSSNGEGDDGVLTLFIGAGIALFVAAVSSGGRGGGQGGRRREVVRQRTATRAAKTVGSYVEPPQRTAAAALLLHLWGNLKRDSELPGIPPSLEGRSAAVAVRPRQRR
ncbi:expressed unknown protein [Ectocarpus siliculosus]|uniref:Uncharacterized protein n=1 Tax=Ectocarpus siliculosus TaxID=2880 RepID=D7FJX8_ECTSI|nr:expressed unknown protein [Ectocarpus siliculosus]|eukprot:CBJ29226.1 expressed unknown protein [Ectocarpus siliculosus]